MTSNEITEKTTTAMMKVSQLIRTLSKIRATISRAMAFVASAKPMRAMSPMGVSVSRQSSLDRRGADIEDVSWVLVGLVIVAFVLVLAAILSEGERLRRRH